MKIKINFEDVSEGSKKDLFFYKLLSKRFDVEISPNPDFFIYSRRDREYLKCKCIKIFYTAENCRPDLNECNYAFTFDYIDDKRHFRLPLFRLYDEYDDLFKKRDFNSILKRKTRFCNFIYSSGISWNERYDFFSLMQKYKKVDSAGKSYNNTGYFVKDKQAFQRECKFSIAFENSSYLGYTTEKILHAFTADTIPIYWGNPAVDKDFNTKAFINCHDYKSFDEVIDRVIEIDNNDELYLQYLKEPALAKDNNSDYLDEEKILDKFEEIFNDKDSKPITNKIDILKYYSPKFIYNTFFDKWRIGYIQV